MRAGARAAKASAAVAVVVASLFAVGAAAAEEAVTPRVTLFLEPDFPAVDVPAPDALALMEALGAARLRVAGLDSLAAALAPGRTDVLILPYGSAFPAQAWPALHAYLAAGGNWINLGGVPLAVPVVRDHGLWRALERTVTWHRRIGIVQAEELPPLHPDPKHAQGTFALTVRFTNSKLRPTEDGSDGPRETILSPLMVTSTSGDSPGGVVEVSMVRFDHLGGEFAGGSWAFSLKRDLPPEFLLKDYLAGDLRKSHLSWIASGAAELRVRPGLALYRPGEPMSLALEIRRPGRRAAPVGPVRLELRQGGSWPPLATAEVTLAGEGDRLTSAVPWPRDWPEQLPEGRYEVAADARLPGSDWRVSGSGSFLVSPVSAIAGGARLSADGAVFTLDGKPLPVTGTTYMDSQAHRRFLLEPDPLRWQRDFGAMLHAGVNLVRTGIWTGWDEHCEPGRPVPSEAVLRAFEAWLLTARLYHMPVIFTFFAFVPPAWGGENPYLDPRAVAAQSEFVAAFARRFAPARDLAWDLINEPSFSSPQRLWQCRPNYDASEQAAWAAWLRRLAGGREGEDLALFLQDRWGAIDGDPTALPPLDDFADRHLFGDARPRRAADYRRFAQDAFAGWTRQLTAVIREAGAAAAADAGARASADGRRVAAAGAPRQLVTVGQDEGGLHDRPGPLFFGLDVDFTCTHTWWNNDDLLWDGVMARLPDRPLLIEETGLMTYERPDGSAWRDGEAQAKLLSRKLALAVAAGGAGFVQWCWNSNPYMPSDNEAGIGFLRADRMWKPELAVFQRYARFLQRHAALFRGMEPEETVIVAPHSQILSGRDLATAATQRAVRVLEYELGLPVRAVAEHALAAMFPPPPAGASAGTPAGTPAGMAPTPLPTAASAPKLIVLPSPRVLADDAWAALLRAVDRGATLCVSGPFDRDEVERPAQRAAALGLRVGVRPVAPAERIVLDDGTTVAAPFRGGRLERVETAVVDGDAASVRVVPYGAGAIVWSPVPVELAEGPTAAAAVYAACAARAGAASPIARAAPDPALLVRPVVFADAILVACVNESADDRTAAFTHRASGRTHARPVPAQDAVLLWIDRRTGELLGASDQRR